MAASLVPGQRTWSGSQDSEGHREYKIKFLVRHAIGDGPAVVRACPGLPTYGSSWNFDNDVDPWAFRKNDDAITIHQEKEGDPNRYSTIEFTYTSKPNSKKCQDVTITDPLMEPQKISGEFVKDKEEAAYDRFGNPLVNSAWEQMRGPQTEFDKSHSKIKIEQNVGSLNLGLCESMKDTVNGNVMWGLVARTIKLAAFSWERKFYGACNVYYTRSFEFEIRTETWDRFLVDEGTKVLSGHWGSNTGTGCTLNITAGNITGASGTILSATIQAPGSGYPASSTISLLVTGGGGTGGIVVVGTDATGAVSAVGYVSNGGRGYTTTAAAATSTSVWILDKIDGQVPNRYNPQHFIKFKDRRGENCRVLLDGGGLPVTYNNATSSSGAPGFRYVQRYNESNFFLLGIPVTF